MKAAFQIGLLLVIGVGIIGGVTFVVHYNSATRLVPSEPRETRAGTALVFLATSVQWDALASSFAAEYEVQQPGHFDFWFQNPQPNSVAVSLAAKSKACTDVRVGISSAGAWNDYRVWSQTAGPSWCLATGGTVADLLTPVGMATWATNVQWQQLDAGARATVPPAASKQDATVGLVRVGWQANKLGPETVRVELGTRELPDGREAPIKLEVPILGVAPLRVHPATVDVGELDPNGPPVATQFWCWSATRGPFALTAREATGDPCLVVTSSPLASEERLALARKLASQDVPTHIRQGFRVEILVHPSRSDREQIDLGPFQREVLVTTDFLMAPLRVPISGSVRSDVLVGSPEDKGRINLGNIAAARGETRVVTLRTEQPRVHLQVDSVSPDFLRVKLEEVRQPLVPGKKRWRLHVEIPPNRVAGPFPANSAILLKTQEGSARRLRIPVLGHAYR